VQYRQATVIVTKRPITGNVRIMLSRTPGVCNYRLCHTSDNKCCKLGFALKGTRVNKINFFVHRSRRVLPIFNQINAVYVLKLYLFEMCLKIYSTYVYTRLPSILGHSSLEIKNCKYFTLHLFVTSPAHSFSFYIKCVKYSPSLGIFICQSTEEIPLILGKSKFRYAQEM